MEIRQFTLNFSDIDFNSGLIYKMLRLESNDENELYHSIISDEIEKAKQICSIKGGYCIFDHLRINHDYISVDNKILKVGNNIASYLKKSDRLAIFNCTAGREIEIHSRKLMAEGNLLEGYISDVIGSVLVETAMDRIQESLSREMATNGLKISNRYSPGYCQWDVSDQKLLFSFFPEKFCGISLSETCLMSPIKSVSGIIGIGKDIRFYDYFCDTCSIMECIYRGIKSRV